MNAFWGADTESLRSAGSMIVRRADALADLESMLAATIENVEWTGEDAEAFRGDWRGQVRPSLQDHGVELRQKARRLLQHADEQDAASAPEGSGASHGPTGLSPRPRIADNLMLRLDDPLGGLEGGPEVMDNLMLRLDDPLNGLGILPDVADDLSLRLEQPPNPFERGPIFANNLMLRLDDPLGGFTGRPEVMDNLLLQLTPEQFQSLAGHSTASGLGALLGEAGRTGTGPSAPEDPTDVRP